MTIDPKSIPGKYRLIGVSEYTDKRDKNKYITNIWLNTETSNGNTYLFEKFIVTLETVKKEGEEIVSGVKETIEVKEPKKTLLNQGEVGDVEFKNLYDKFNALGYKWAENGDPMIAMRKWAATCAGRARKVSPEPPMTKEEVEKKQQIEKARKQQEAARIGMKFADGITKEKVMILEWYKKQLQAIQKPLTSFTIVPGDIFDSEIIVKAATALKNHIDTTINMINMPSDKYKIIPVEVVLSTSKYLVPLLEKSASMMIDSTTMKLLPGFDPKKIKEMSELRRVLISCIKIFEKAINSFNNRKPYLSATLDTLKYGDDETYKKSVETVKYLVNIYFRSPVLVKRS